MLQNWVQDLLNTLQEPQNEKMGVELLEKCGRSCARRAFCKNVDAFKNSVIGIKDPDILLDRLNKVWGKLRREDGNIYVVYEECFCPIMSSGTIKTPFFCNCSRGWIKEVMETVLERPVEVVLEKSVSRGDGYCKFRVIM